MIDFFLNAKLLTSCIKKENHSAEFWLGSRTGFSTISEMALIHGSATYLCEAKFSELQIIKSKYASTLKNTRDALYP